MRKLLLVVLSFAVLGAAMAEELVVWTTFGDRSLAWLEGELEAFSEAFDVEVEVAQVALGELREQMLLTAPEGGAADLLVGVPHDQILELVQAGVLADVSTYATKAFLADLSAPARSAFEVGDGLFGLPLAVEGPALIVNTDLVPQPPASYEEMIEVAADLTAGETFGFLFPIGDFYYTYNWLHSLGGYLFGRAADGTYLPDDVGLANEGARRGAEMVRELSALHGLVPPDTDYDTANRLFAEGLVGMTYNGPWAVGLYRRAGVPLAVMPLPPRADGGSWSGLMGVLGVLMNEYSESRADAATLAKWLVRPEAQAALAAAAGRIPASSSALALSAGDELITGFGRALQSAEPIPNIPEMGRVWQPMGAAMRLVLEAEEDEVGVALEKAVREILGE